MRSLADKVKLGGLTLKNRIVMSAMTRRRTDQKTAVPNDLMATYFAQRAGAGLILTESATVSPRGDGFPGNGAIYNKAQVEGWSKVVDAVHKKDGVIFLQVFHAGRNCHSSFIGGMKTIAPSAIAIRNNVPGYNNLPFETPLEITHAEIEHLKGEFLNGFQNAKAAGFDGVQIHGANGYIVDEFIRTSTNKRTDKYGGSVQNRTRFPLEIVDLAIKVFGNERVSIKLSPVARYGDMFDENPLQTYSYLLQQLDQRKIGFVELVSQRENPSYGYTPPAEQMPNVMAQLRPYFKGLLVGNQGYTVELAKQDLEKGDIDLVSIGRPYIVNPDLAERFLNNWPIETKLDFSTFYLGDGKGYTDWPYYKA